MNKYTISITYPAKVCLCMDSVEKKFKNCKSILQQSCCASKKSNKLQIFSIKEDGYRIYCQKCFKMADGKTFEEVKNKFNNKQFKF